MFKEENKRQTICLIPQSDKKCNDMHSRNKSR